MLANKNNVNSSQQGALLAEVDFLHNLPADAFDDPEPNHHGGLIKRTADDMAQAPQEEEATQNIVRENPLQTFERQKMAFIADNQGNFNQATWQILSGQHAHFAETQAEIEQSSAVERWNREDKKIRNMIAILAKPQEPIRNVFKKIKDERPSMPILDYYQIIMLWRAGEYQSVEKLCDLTLKNIEVEEWAYRMTCSIIPHYLKIGDDLVLQHHLHAMINYFPLSEVYFFLGKAQKALEKDDKNATAECYYYRALNCFAHNLLYESKANIDKALEIINPPNKYLEINAFLELLINDEQDAIIYQYNGEAAKNFLKKNTRFCLEFFGFLIKKGKLRPLFQKLLFEKVNDPQTSPIEKLKILHAKIMFHSKSNALQQSEFKAEVSAFLKLYLKIENPEPYSGLLSEVLITSFMNFREILLENLDGPEYPKLIKSWMKAVKKVYEHYKAFGTVSSSPLSFGNFLNERLYLNALNICINASMAIKIIADEENNLNPHVEISDLVQDFENYIRRELEALKQFKLSSDNGDHRSTRVCLDSAIQTFIEPTEDISYEDFVELCQEALSQNMINSINTSFQSNTTLAHYQPERNPSFETSLANHRMSKVFEFLEYESFLVQGIGILLSAMLLSAQEIQSHLKEIVHHLKNMVKIVNELSSAHVKINKNNILDIIDIHYFYVDFISKNMNINQRIWTADEVGHIISSIKACDTLSRTLVDSYASHSSDKIDGSDIPYVQVLEMLNHLSEIQNRMQQSTQKPLALMYGKKESSQHLVEFPVDKIIGMMNKDNEIYRFRVNANISVHCITLVISHNGKKSTITLSAPNMTVDPTKLPCTSNDIAHVDPKYQDTILRSVRLGETLMKDRNFPCRYVETVNAHEFSNQLHKHSEQYFYVWLLKKGSDFIVSALNEKAIKPSKILAVLFDYGSNNSSCCHCRSTALAIQSKDGQFVKELEEKLKKNDYTLPSNGLYLTTRVLYLRSYDKDARTNPKEKNIKFLNNLGIFQELTPAVYASGSDANHQRSLVKK